MLNTPRFAALALPLGAVALLTSTAAAQPLIASAVTRLDTTAVVVDTVAPDSAPPTVIPKLGLALSGYVETAFNYSNRANGNAITGRLYERTSNQFALNALKLSLDRPFDPRKVDAGFHADVIFGQNAQMLQSTGFNLGPNGDVYQLFATLNLPTPNGNGVQVRVGRMSTFMGVEMIETPVNPNLSIGNEFIYVENFTQTGVSVEHRFNRVVDAQFRVLNGWDQVQDVNTRLSYMARLGLSPTDRTTIAIEGFAGPEQVNNNTAIRSGAELMVSHRIGKVTTIVQGDIGREDRNSALFDPTRTARWHALSSWVVIDASPGYGVALRADYVDDATAARTGAAFGLTSGQAHHLSSATATLNVKKFPGILLRPELRYDHSNQMVFKSRESQVTLGLSAAYLF
jgi:hypothetical protein